MGEDDHVGAGAAEIAEVALEIIGQVLAAVGADDQVVGSSFRRRQRVHRHSIHGELVEVDVSGGGEDGENGQEQEEQHPPRPRAAAAHGCREGGRDGLVCGWIKVSMYNSTLAELD